MLLKYCFAKHKDIVLRKLPMQLEFNRPYSINEVMVLYDTQQRQAYQKPFLTIF